MNQTIALLCIIGIGCISCKKETIEKRKFTTSFESVIDFDGFYITPQNHLNTTNHNLSDSLVYSGNFSHKAWVMGTNPPSTILVNNNHRGYPTVQLYKTSGGSFQTPCYIIFHVWLDMSLQTSTTGNESDWFSFATFCDDESDNWSRTVLVNLSNTGFVHLQHVPLQGKQEHIFQTSTLPFPQNEWVELKVYLDFAKGKYAKVWQNGQLVSHAKIDDIENKLAQAHFGMYCPPQITSGIVYNDDLTIEMVNGE